MGQSTKAFGSLVLIVASVIAAVVWSENHPTSTTWILRVSMTLIAILSLAALLALHFRRDLAHDYLRDISGRYFNRGGFCFSFSAVVVDGVCQLQAFYQNQYKRPCMGRIALRPAKGFWLTRAKIKALSFKIPCEAAAFGVATLPIPVPRELLGKRQSFEVGAAVVYPKGKGRRLRFRDGIFLRTNTEFDRSFETALVLAGALTGHIVWHRPATTTIQLPDSAAEHLPENAASSVKAVWKRGDPPLARQ